MQVEFKEKPDFIQKDGCTGGYINHVNGAPVFTTNDGFKQVLKRSEYEQIVGGAETIGEDNVPEEEAEEPEEEQEEAEEASREDELKALTNKQLQEIIEEQGIETDARKKDDLVQAILESEGAEE